MDRNLIMVDVANPRHQEEMTLDATGGILPGALVQRHKSVANTVVPVLHANAGRGTVMIVLENIYEGKTINDLIVDGDYVRLYVPQSGDKLNLVLKTGTTVVEGTAFEFEAGGLVKINTTGTPFAVSVENTGGVGSAANLHLIAQVS